MKVAAVFASIIATANAFAPATPLSTGVRSDSALSMAMERTYIMVSLFIAEMVTVHCLAHENRGYLSSLRENIMTLTSRLFFAHKYRSSPMVSSVVSLETLCLVSKPRDTSFLL
jgi:hypothetical protein